MTESMPSAQGDDAPPSFWQTVGSVLAAFFGVQSSRARKRDFTRGQPWHYVVVGLVVTIVFVAVLAGLVRLVLTVAGV